MKILLYSEGMKYISHSGVGKAIIHQMKALELNNISYTTDKNDKNYDVIHINTVGPRGYLLAKTAHYKGKKVILHAHSTEEDFYDSFFFANWLAPLFKKWLVVTYKLADEIITPTPYSKKILESYNLNVPIHAVSNGIDLESFTKNLEKGMSFRKKYGFNETDKIIISVGLNIKRKGIFDFVELAKSMPECHFVWCGYTNPHLLASDVRQLLKNPPSNAHFIGYLDDLLGAYSGSDVFFMPTYEETEGIVVLEALSIKIPIVIRDIPVYEGWLTNKVNCYKCSDNKEFELIIKGILDGKLEDLTNKGYEVAEERTLTKIGSQLSTIYKNLIREV